MHVHYKGYYMNALSLDDFLSITKDNRKVFAEIWGPCDYKKGDVEYWNIRPKKIGSVLVESSKGGTKFYQEVNHWKGDYRKLFSNYNWLIFLRETLKEL